MMFSLLTETSIWKTLKWLSTETLIPNFCGYWNDGFHLLLGFPKCSHGQSQTGRKNHRGCGRYAWCCGRSWTFGRYFMIDIIINKGEMNFPFKLRYVPAMDVQFRSRLLISMPIEMQDHFLNQYYTLPIQSIHTVAIVTLNCCLFFSFLFLRNSKVFAENCPSCR